MLLLFEWVKVQVTVLPGTLSTHAMLTPVAVNVVEGFDEVTCLLSESRLRQEPEKPLGLMVTV